jgi:hypothetical protein
MQMTLNLNLFPSEMMEDITHVDDEFNQIHRHNPSELLQKIRRRNKEAEAGTPLRPLRSQAPPASAPLALEDEEEIFYLARTAAVPRSFWPISFRRP